MEAGLERTLKKTVTYRQMRAMLYLSLLSPAIRIFPGEAASLAGKCAWLSPLAAAPLLYLLTMLINRFTKQVGPGEGMPEMIIKAAGKTGGRIILGIIALWLIFYMGIIVRASSERLISTVFQTGKPVVFSVTLVVAALLFAMGKLRSLGRMAEIFLFFIGSVLVVTIAAGIKDCHIENLFPITVFDVPDVLMGAVPVINVVGAGVYIAFLDCGIEGKNGRGYWNLTIILFTITALTAVTIGVLSSELITRLQYPFFVMVRDITILGIIERIEAVVIVLWVITDLIYMSVLLKVIGRLLTCAVCRGNNKIFLGIGAALSMLPVLFAVNSAFEVNFLSQYILPVINILITLCVVPLVLGVGYFRTKKDKKR